MWAGRGRHRAALQQQWRGRPASRPACQQAAAAAATCPPGCPWHLPGWWGRARWARRTSCCTRSPRCCWRAACRKTCAKGGGCCSTPSVTARASRRSWAASPPRPAPRCCCCATREATCWAGTRRSRGRRAAPTLVTPPRLCLVCSPPPRCSPLPASTPTSSGAGWASASCPTVWGLAARRAVTGQAASLLCTWTAPWTAA
mmetsp:Transcript_3069/g.7701  ORF Transcript_3069/g.7701 Transcript_3069/m.7701 type:complete len:201 (+) Transcript_3069:128-730(+)